MSKKLAPNGIQVQCNSELPYFNAKDFYESLLLIDLAKRSFRFFFCWRSLGAMSETRVLKNSLSS